mmetsp:Transcript_5635/g.15490  ORF Transcript_5635/g.15490 Transcript_5635/m.15490 type:complete len:193 (+) Transcript_5635:55-633(+)
MGSAFSEENAGNLGERRSAAFQTLYSPGHKVELVATTLGPRIPGMQAYHTSVVVDEIEFSFSFDGVTHGPGLLSHKHLPNGPPAVTYMGLTSISGKQMLENMRSNFKRGSYDLLRKNCNSFSDCALFYLLDVRLDPSYRGLEKIGHAADKNVRLVQTVSGGEYTPNREADGFEVEDVIRRVNKDKQKEFETR